MSEVYFGTPEDTLGKYLFPKHKNSTVQQLSQGSQ